MYIEHVALIKIGGIYTQVKNLPWDVRYCSKLLEIVETIKLQSASAA